MDPYDTYADLLDAVEETGAPYRVLDRAPGGRPIVGVEAGGEREPAVLVTAGAHATEHAGVVAAVELIEALDTDHQVYVVPSRDPVGLDGYASALELSLGERVDLDGPGDVEPLLRSAGEVVHEDDEGRFVLALVGDHGYASGTDEFGSASILSALKEVWGNDPGALEPLGGVDPGVARRGVDPPSLERLEGAGVDAAEGLERAYTLVVDTDGLPLHLNRFFTTEWAPPESRAVRALADEVEPGLTFDNHETSGHDDRYHVSLRPQRTDVLQEREREVGLAVTEAVAASGTPLATDDDVLGPTGTVAYADEQPEEPFYSRAGDGGYWVDPNVTDPPRHGEGLNATDYAAEHYGLAYTNESGMYAPFERRVDAQVTAVRRAVEAFEQFYG